MSSGEKKRVTVTLSEENVDWLDEKYNNRSGFIDDMLTQYRTGDIQTEQGLHELRAEQLLEEALDLESEKNQLERKAERKRKKAERYLEQSETAEEQTEAELAEAREALEEAGVNITPTNPAVENWAEKLGMTPVELVEKLEDGENE